MRLSQVVLLASLLWGVSQPPLRAQGTVVSCPGSLSAPFGGEGGWSSVKVQATFVKALMDGRRRLMTCQYGFGMKPEPFFGVQMPCPKGVRCLVIGNGFRLLPE